MCMEGGRKQAEEEYACSTPSRELGIVSETEKFCQIGKE